jgi:hypothetical protein
VVVAGLIPCSTAAASTNVLNVEPDWRRPWESRLNWFFVLPGMTAVMARMAPFFGLIEITPAAGSSRSVSVSRIAVCAARWKRGSIVV